MKDEQMEESLSALMDGELPHARAERVLDRVLGDAEMRERWRRNHLISAALSSQHSLLVADEEVASRVRDALDAEVVPLRRPTRRLSWSVGIAVAASVATLAVLVLFDVSNQPPTLSGAAPLAALPASTGPASTGNGPVAPAAVSTVALNRRSRTVDQVQGSALTRMTWNDARPVVKARLNSYLLDHNEYLADGVRGMLPYARVVGYDGSN